MDDKKVLLDHIDQLHTTDMGISRIEKNLKLDTDDVVRTMHVEPSTTQKNSQLLREKLTPVFILNSKAPTPLPMFMSMANWLAVTKAATPLSVSTSLIC